MTVRLRPRPSAKSQQKIPPGFFSGDQVRARLGLSERDMQRLAQTKEFRAERRTRNRWALYSEEQVKRLEMRLLDGSLQQELNEDASSVVGAPIYTMRAHPARPDVVAQNSPRVFKMLYDGIPPHIIVIQTELAANVVDLIRQDYDRMSGAMSIPREILERMNAVKRLNGRFPLRSPADILEVFQLADGARVCTTCRNVGASSECGGCVYQRAETDVKERLAAEQAVVERRSRPRPAVVEDETVPEQRQARTGT